MTALYDAGALVRADRSDRAFWAEHRARLERGEVPLTTAPVVAQVSRSPRQVPLRRLLSGCQIVPFDEGDAHHVGVLVASSGVSDVVDAHVALVAARHRAVVLTSDEDDLRALVAQIPNAVRIRRV